MSKTFGLVTAAALLASVTAFAQENPAAPAAGGPAASDNTSTSSEEAKPAKHHRHHAREAGSKSTDNNADKLNACMSDATPTPQQQACLAQAAGQGGG